MQLLVDLERLDISTIKIPTVSRDAFLNCILGDVNLSNLKLGILGESKSIKKDEKMLKKYDAFFKEPENVNYAIAVKSQSWAEEKDAPDYAFHLMFGIEYLRKMRSNKTAFDIINKCALGITTLGSSQNEATRILEHVYSIDVFYEQFTCVFQDPQLSSSTAASLLQQSILHRAAAVLEPISKASSVGGKDCLAIRHLLEAFLHEVFVTRKGVPGHRYQYTRSYAQLFCHCIRHDCSTFSGDSVEMSNRLGRETSSCTLDAKLYVDIIVSLVSIVGMVLSDADSFSLPLQLSTLLTLPVREEPLAPDGLEQLESERER